MVKLDIIGLTSLLGSSCFQHFTCFLELTGFMGFTRLSRIVLITFSGSISANQELQQKRKMNVSHFDLLAPPQFKRQICENTPWRVHREGMYSNIRRKSVQPIICLIYSYILFNFGVQACVNRTPLIFVVA